MKKVILGLLVFGFASQINAQIIELKEVIISTTNYKYLNAVDARDTAVPVKMLQEEVAKYDVTSSDFYVDEYDLYKVSFFIPEGKILAAYDKKGNILHTVEKFDNVKLPKVVNASIEDRFPGWEIKRDVYRVSYEDGKSKKEYKVVLKNGDKILRVKLDADGSFL